MLIGIGVATSAQNYSEKNNSFILPNTKETPNSSQFDREIMTTNISNDNNLTFTTMYFNNMKNNFSYISNSLRRKSLSCQNKLGLNNSSFYGECNRSIYTITVSSSKEIRITNMSFEIRVIIKENETTSLEDFSGIFLTNGKDLYFMLGSGYPSASGLQYIHFKVGPFNYTYDNRSLKTWKGPIGGCSGGDRDGLILPAGEWHFILVGGVYDLQQEDIQLNSSILINFNKTCEDINVSTSEEGKYYPLWYGDLDANVIISKRSVFDLMMNGRYTFHINDNFIYLITGWPSLHGFWNIRWNTPSGLKHCHVILRRNYWFYNSSNFNACITGVGGSGVYKLTTGYLDRLPKFFNDNLPWPYTDRFYMVGLDVPFN